MKGPMALVAIETASAREIMPMSRSRLAANNAING